jgi:hypothetical protein
MVDHRVSAAWSVDRRLSWLHSLRNQSESLVWLDQSDSSGTAQFEVVDFVDRYVKRHVLRKPERYHDQNCNVRVHEAYYDRYFESPHGTPRSSSAVDRASTLDAEAHSKVRIGWTFAYCDVGSLSRSSQMWRGIRGQYTGIRAGGLERPCAISALFTAGHESSIGKAREIALEVAQDNGWLTLRSRLDAREYFHALQQSEISVSPFGWGEMCVRDFEIACAGGALAKPSVEHLSTFPSLLVPHESYVPLSWDPRLWPDEIAAARTRSDLHAIAARLGTWPSSLSSGLASAEFVDHFLGCVLGDEWCGHCERGWWGP